MKKFQIIILVLSALVLQGAAASGQITCPPVSAIKASAVDPGRVVANARVVQGSIPFGVQVSGNKTNKPLTKFVAAVYAQGVFMCAYAYQNNKSDPLTLSNYDMVGPVKNWEFIHTKGTTCKASDSNVNDCVLQSEDY